MAAVPGRQHAVEQVDPEGDRLDDADRVAYAHEVAGLVVGQLGQRDSERFQHGVTVLANREAADRVAVEAHLERPVRGLDPQAGVGAALHDAELAQLGPLQLHERGTRPFGPTCGAIDSGPQDVQRRRQRRADVEDHLDVAAELRLDLHRQLWCEPVGTAVVGGAEGGAVVVDARFEREHLVAA